MSHPHPELATASGATGVGTEPGLTVMPSPRALTARRALRNAVLLGIIADPLLRNGPWGLGLFAWIVALAAATIALVRADGRAVAVETKIWLLIAIVFSGMLAWRDSEMLYGVNVLAMLIALVLVAMSINGIPVASVAAARVRDVLSAGMRTGIDVMIGVFPLVMRETQFNTVRHPATGAKARRLAKAIAIALPIVIVFAMLLTQADPVFGSFVRIPNIDLSHVIVAGFFAWVVAGWLHRSFLARTDEQTPVTTTSLPFAIGATDLAFVLGALNVLFAAFVVVQIGWLFGGESLVLRTTGLSYAAYARRGFFELIWVAALLLPTLLCARALIPADDLRALRLFRRLAIPLVILLGAIAASAVARMSLYIRYYGLTDDRIYASAFMVWLVLVFAWLGLTVLRLRPRTFVAGMAVSGFAVLFALNCINPDAYVARDNLVRGSWHTTGAPRTDLAYLASLGGDAVPLVLPSLTVPAVVADSALQRVRCAAAKIILDRWTGERRLAMVRNWAQWNLARTHAAQAVRAHEGELRQVTCPAPQSP